MQKANVNAGVSFIEAMAANPRPLEVVTPRPKPTVEELRTAREAAHRDYAEAKEKTRKLSGKLEETRKRRAEVAAAIAEAEGRRAELFEKIAVDEAGPKDLEAIKRTLAKAKEEEGELVSLYGAIERAHEAAEKERARLRELRAESDQRFWCRVAEDIAAELRSTAGGLVARYFAALAAANRVWGQDFGLLGSAFTTPKPEEVKAILAEMEKEADCHD